MRQRTCRPPAIPLIVLHDPDQPGYALGHLEFVHLLHEPGALGSIDRKPVWIRQPSNHRKDGIVPWMLRRIFHETTCGCPLDRASLTLDKTRHHWNPFIRVNVE